MRKLLLALCLLWNGNAWGAYQYYRQIDLPTPAANLTDFTILICANVTLGNGNACPSVSGLNQSGAGAKVTQADGDDIAFGTAGNATCGTKYKWDTLRLYTASSGALITWVGPITLSSGGGNKLFICYGDSTVTTFQGGSTGAAWDANLKAFWHLDDNAANTTVTDASANANTLTARASAGSANTADWTTTSAQFVRAFTLDGGTSERSASRSTSGSYLPITVVGWINAPSLGTMVLIDYSSGANDGIRFRLSATNLFVTFGGVADYDCGAALSTATWLYVSFRIDAALGTAKCRVNGSTGSIAVGTPGGTLGSIDLGRATFIPGQYLAATIDAFRIETANRSDEWDLQRYNNESTPNSFLTYGSEVAVTPRNCVIGAGVIC